MLLKRRKFSIGVLGALLFVLINDTAATPDLIVDLSRLWNSVVFYPAHIAEQCEVGAECIFGSGVRRVIKFETATKNIGNHDLEIGYPDDHPDWYEYSSCHGHDHFIGFMEYAVFSLSCSEFPGGNKMGFYLENVETNDGSPGTIWNGCSRSRFFGGYNCDYQGIGEGCADVYGHHLPCQLIDITWTKVFLPPAGGNGYLRVYRRIL